MKPTKVYVYAGSILLVLLVALVWIGTNRDQKPTDSKSEIVQPKPQRKIADREDPALSADHPELPQGLQPSALAMIRTEVEVDAVFNEIEAAAITYDAEELPILESYLFDPDPEIRQAALNGMLTLGDAAASPLLREAAENAYSPQEAVAMLEAADYLELPSGTLPPIKKNVSGKRLRKELSVKPLQFEKFLNRDTASSAIQSSDEPSLSP